MSGDQDARSAAKSRLSRLQGHLQADPTQGFARRTTETMERLKQERARASFAVRQMTHYLDNGEEYTLIKVRERTLQRVRHAYHLLIQDGGDVARRNCRLEIHCLHDLGWYVRQGVHFGLFMGALSGQGSDEQRAEWLPKTMMCEIYGCFGMTELGHGSALRSLETTAHYDKDTEEFIINTPTETATKWWIGAAGQTATHSVVFARLILDEDGDVGVHNFIVPLRDMDTHEALPGVHVGDLGAKMGLNGIDNGWMQFDHVRVPRDYMLCRYAQVTPEGRYVRPPKKEMAYGALIGTRAALIKTAVDFQKKALMIAVRYGAMRAQGMVGDNDTQEVVLLDYPMHAHKLLTLLASAYAWHFQADYVLKLNDKLEDGLASGDLSILNDVHGTMAGLKAFGTWHTYHCIEVCRQSLGGHGYSKYTGLSSTLQDFAVMCTWEGDNTVMALQTGRYLVRSYEKALKGEKLAGSVDYLQASFPPHWRVATPVDLLDQSLQREGWGALLASRVKSVAEKVLDTANKNGGNVPLAFTRHQVELYDIARVHVNLNVAIHFMDALHDVRRQHTDLYPVLKRLCDVFSLLKLLEESSGLLESGFADGAQIGMAREQLFILLSELRPDAVALVDAFNYSDAVLGSYLGAADGNIYSRYLKHVQTRVPENRGGGVAPYYASEIKPLLSGEDLVST